MVLRYRAVETIEDAMLFPLKKGELVHATPTGRAYFACPKCGDTNVIAEPTWTIDPGEKDGWAPTVSPSISSTHMAGGFDGDGTVCKAHYFIRRGEIEWA